MKQFQLIALAFFAFALQVKAQEAMAPIDQYLMADRDAEIALARSAAPPSIGKDATILVLGRHGYETAVKGTNGFVCNVDRSWGDRFDSKEFWNPKRLGPVCYNPQAAKMLLPILRIRTRMALAGKSKAEMNEGLKAAIAKGELPAFEPGAMAFMLSKDGHLTDGVGHWHPHLMFYVPLKDRETWAPDAPDSPVLLNPHFDGQPEPVTEFVVVVSKWSDGTPDAAEGHQH